MTNEIKQEIPCPKCGRTDYQLEAYPKWQVIGADHYAVTSCCHSLIDVRVTEKQTPTTGEQEEV